MFHALKWIIERESFTPEIRKEMDKDICNNIVNLLNPKTQEDIGEDLPKEGYRCMKCEGVPNENHGLYCKKGIKEKK